MAVQSPVPATNVVAAANVFSDTDAQRWTAWQQRGAAHDRAVRGRMIILAPLVALSAATLAWFIF